MAFYSRERVEEQAGSIVVGTWSKLHDYKELVKLRLSMTVVFSSVMAFLVSDTATPHQWTSLGALALGGFLVTGAANALNEVLEKDFDKLMTRTANRPLASGRMKVSEAVLAAGLMSMTGIILLALINPWTAFFGTLSLVIYAFLYTPLKRFSTVAVAVGAVSGAFPTLIGSVAASGTITMLGMLLFLVQFLWQFPHFWSIGYLGFQDYSKAGYKLLPEVNGEFDRRAAFQACLYAGMLVVATLIPGFLGYLAWWAVGVASVLSLAMVWFSMGFYKHFDRKAALRLMFASFIYIPAVLVVFYLGRI